MTANLTPAEARAWNAAVEAAAREADAEGWPGQMTAPRYLGMSEREEGSRDCADRIAVAIRALSVPIPPEPDVEAVVNVAAGPLLHSRMPNVALHDARAVVAALTAAGMLR